jgi:hypothetical protein
MNHMSTCDWKGTLVTLIFRHLISGFFRVEGCDHPFLACGY